MVVGQVAGLFTAFGTGELSGAGFGPNYTILMKLGYEFYAPRILDEMQKHDKRSFEDTQYWRAFQTHIKLYSDRVMTETLDKLLTLPQATIDALTAKWGGDVVPTAPSAQKEGVYVFRGGIMSFLTPAISILPDQLLKQVEQSQEEVLTPPPPPADVPIPEQLTPESVADRARRIAKAKADKISGQKVYHPQFFRQMKSLQNNRNALLNAMKVLNMHIKKQEAKLKQMIRDRNKQGTPGKASGIIISNQKKVIARMYVNRFQGLKQIAKVQATMDEFNSKFKPTR